VSWESDRGAENGEGERRGLGVHIRLFGMGGFRGGGGAGDGLKTRFDRSIAEWSVGGWGRDQAAI